MRTCNTYQSYAYKVKGSQQAKLDKEYSAHTTDMKYIGKKQAYKAPILLYKITIFVSI